MKKVIVIVGPTGSGKTKLSIDLAKCINAEIINGDAVQIYQGLDIGSAKIKAHDMQGIIHHLIDFRNPQEPYSVFEFQRDVRTLLDQIDTPMIVGGTGLYIKAALYQYDFLARERTSVFESKLNDMTLESLYSMLISKDPLSKVDPKNKRRIIRALEMIDSGIMPSGLDQKNKPLYEILILYLDINKDTLEDRLIKRLDHMLDEGFIDEVRSLKSQGIISQAIGYKEINRYLDGEIDEITMKQDIIKSTKRLAKKQKTWFKNQETPIFLDALSSNLHTEALRHVKTFLKKDKS